MNHLNGGRNFEPDRDFEPDRYFEPGRQPADPSYVAPVIAAAIADAAASAYPEAHLGALCRQRFRAGNRPEWGPAARDTAEAALARTRRRIADGERRLRRTPETRIVTRPGDVPGPRLYTVMGWTMLGLALVMLTPIPLVVAIGIAEASMTLEALFERPWLAVFYGFAPWGAVAALKLLRQALTCETLKSRLDAGLVLVTLAAFALWIETYAAAFLADTSAGPEAAYHAASGLATFYKAQLLLEVTAGYVAWTLAERLLSQGMVHEVVPNAAHRALAEAQARDRTSEAAQAAHLDGIDAAVARFDAAEADFVATILGRLADYQDRLKALSDLAHAEARSALRAELIRPEPRKEA
jgi:hypothetical protein